MTHSSPSFPFFAPVESRPLSSDERAVLDRLLSSADAKYKRQVDALAVVGRCGCLVCPTIFFVPHNQGDVEQDLVSMIGLDATGPVGAVLTQKGGVLSQLEFYSVDGHDPWSMPDSQSLTLAR